LWLNGEKVPRRRLPDFEDRDRFGNVIVRARHYEETLPSGKPGKTGKTYTTLDLGMTDGDSTEVFVVPPKHYFVMGDNRDNSQDSRFPVLRGGVGFLPAENLIGRAEVRWISVDGSSSLMKPWTWPGGFRFSRMFTSIE
jgi:signal peptidase I